MSAGSDLDNIVCLIADPEISLTLDFRRKLAEFLMHQEDRISDLVLSNRQLIDMLKQTNEQNKRIISLVNDAADSILQSIPVKVTQ